MTMPDPDIGASADVARRYDRIARFYDALGDNIGAGGLHLVEVRRQGVWREIVARRASRAESVPAGRQETLR